MTDIKIEMNGKSISADKIADDLQKSVFQMVSDQIREALASVRDPETGEFPTVVITGEDLDSIAVQIEGSDAVVALATERLGGMLEAEQCDETASRVEGPRHAFLCHGSEDKRLVERIAREFRSAGIDVFFDQWCIEPGDSIRQRIDQGLQDCTHFIVLLTQTSMSKPWVNAEIDAGFVRKVSDLCRFVPLRYGLEPTALPPLLAALNSPSICEDTFAEDIRELIGFVYGLTQRPPLGDEPFARYESSTEMGVSPAAKMIIDQLMRNTQHGDLMDPAITHDDVLDGCNLTRNEVVDAIYELEGRGLVYSRVDSASGPMGFTTLEAQARLFVQFDKYYTDWDPEADALRIAADLVNGVSKDIVLEVFAENVGWPARRLNPAVNYLIERELVGSRVGIGHSPWCARSIWGTDDTRRFLSSRS